MVPVEDLQTNSNQNHLFKKKLLLDKWTPFSDMHQIIPELYKSISSLNNLYNNSK